MPRIETAAVLPATYTGIAGHRVRDNFSEPATSRGARVKGSTVLSVRESVLYVLACGPKAFLPFCDGLWTREGMRAKWNTRGRRAKDSGFPRSS